MRAIVHLALFWLVRELGREMRHVDTGGQFEVRLARVRETARRRYPLPFYTRGLDARIDNANTGWKGRGMWMTYSSYLPKFTETRIGSVNHMQIRPNPLAN